MELVKNAVSFVSADPLADLKVAKQRVSPPPPAPLLPLRCFCMPSNLPYCLGGSLHGATCRVNLRRPPVQNSPLRMEYVLPDGVHNLRGFTRQPTGPAPRGAAASLEQTLMLANERFMPVEAVFRPLDIGMQQARAAPPHHLTPVNTTHPMVYGTGARCCSLDHWNWAPGHVAAGGCGRGHCRGNCSLPSPAGDAAVQQHHVSWGHSQLPRLQGAA